MPPTHVPHSIAKSGWLLRRSTVLHRWKKSWVVLYQNGRLAYYENPIDSIAKDIIDIPHDRAIIVGPDYCRDVAPADGKQSDYLFGVKTQNKILHFCADDKDDLMAWKLALEEALSFVFNANRSAMRGAPNAYAGYVMPNSYGGQQTLYAPPGSTVLVTDRGPTISMPDGRTVYVYEQHPYYRNYANDAGLGFLTGAALGSMLFLPWWGMWWWF